MRHQSHWLYMKWECQSMVRGGFGLILSYKFRALSVWGWENVQFHETVWTKPFSRTQTNSLSMVYLHDNLYLYDCIWRLYYIFLCLCSLPLILCCAFTYFPHLSTTPFTKTFNAKLHCLQCFFLNFLPRLIFLYLSANSYRNIDYYCTQTQNVIKTESTTLLNFEYFEKPICNFFWQIPIYKYNSANLQSQSSSTYINIICANLPALIVPGINKPFTNSGDATYLPITNDRPNQWNARRQCLKEHPVRSCNTAVGLLWN